MCKISTSLATVALNAKVITNKQYEFYIDCATSFMAGTFWEEHGNKAHQRYKRFETLNEKLYSLKQEQKQ